jgi:predicted ATPase
MRLIKFRISNFKTIDESEWITTDNITCLVGENEAGKTNVLTALLKLKPADENTKINLISDYPRHKYTEDRDIANSKKFIEAIFEFDSPYQLKYTTSQEPIINEETGEEERQPDLEETVEFKFVKVERYYSGEYKAYGIQKEDDIDSEENYKEIIKNKDNIIEKIPKFVYYASYANLSSELYLPNIINDLNRYDSLSEKAKNKAKTLKVLFDFVKLSPEEILSLGKESQQTKSEAVINSESKNKKEREIMLDSASSNMTRSFKEWWKQGNYIFKFSADGDYFRIWVSDGIRPENIELDNRSSGLQWFFSFYLVFITESAGEHNNSIILLDEPGHTLHPMAQKDLANFFNSLSDKNQLLYTTHSPFLVDPMNITRTKVVYANEHGVTNISDNLKIKKKVAQKSIYPINSAIGITISDTMLIGTKPIIVEGVSDQIYLTYIKRQLMRQKDTNFEEELVFMPVDGTKNIKPVVAIITGKEEELPIVLLDSDVAGNEKKKTLEKGLYKDNEAKILSVEEFIHNKVKYSEIEDIMDENIIEDIVNREFHSDIEDFVYDKSSDKSIILQIEEYAVENEIVLENGWKVKVAQRYTSKDRNESENLLAKWKELFNRLFE